MALITDYQSLKDNVLSWVDRDSIPLTVETMVQLAEKKLMRRLKLVSAEKMCWLKTTAGEPWIAYPSDYGGVRQLRIMPDTDLAADPDAISDETRRLYPITGSMMDASRGLSRPGQPVYYTLFGDRVRLGPIPNGVWVVEWVYYASRLQLSDADPTNWLLQKAPDAYLYGTLLEAEAFFKNDPRIATWGSMLSDSLASLAEEDDALKWSDTDIVMHHEYNATSSNRGTAI